LQKRSSQRKFQVAVRVHICREIRRTRVGQKRTPARKILQSLEPIKKKKMPNEPATRGGKINRIQSSERLVQWEGRERAIEKKEKLRMV